VRVPVGLRRLLLAAAAVLPVHGDPSASAHRTRGGGELRAETPEAGFVSEWE
jgi:hypothetical protein